MVKDEIPPTLKMPATKILRPREKQPTWFHRFVLLSILLMAAACLVGSWLLDYFGRGSPTYFVGAGLILVCLVLNTMCTGSIGSILEVVKRWQKIRE